MPGGAPRHDADAGGDPAMLAAKRELRNEVWDALRAERVARFPGARGRIPNFVGAEVAAERLRRTPAWQRARTVKANPDAPQLPVRQRALEDGKVLMMAAPRLAADPPFLRIDPATLPVVPRQAASIGGAARHGRPLDLDELEPVDLVVVGCVAVSANGVRLGKGGGFADLEFALAWAAGLIGPTTVTATTVHELQVVPRGRIPVAAHDVPVDLIVTPTRVRQCRRASGRFAPVLQWEELTEEKVAAIPLLGRLRPAADT